MKGTVDNNKGLKSKVILFMGFPGSGKGTQGKILADEGKLNIPHLSTGELYRKEAEKKTELGKKMLHYMNLGVPIPNDLTFDYLSNELSSPKYNKGFILDGYPKQIDHLNFLEKILESQEKEIASVLYFSIKRDEVVKRLKGRLFCSGCESNFHDCFHPPKVEGKCDRCDLDLFRREDDTEDAINQRLDVFEEKTKPLKKLFEERGILVQVDANKNIEQLTNEVLEQTSLVFS